MSDQNKKDKLKRMAMALGVPEEDIRREDFRESEILSSTLRMNYKDPQVTIRPDGIQFNNACIRLFEDAMYIYIGYDRDKKWLIINECERDDIDSQRWCGNKNGKLESRKITGRDNSERIYKMMGWNKGYYYKVGGVLSVQDGDDSGEPYLLFELERNHEHALTEKGRSAAGVTDEEVGAEELAKIRAEEEAAAKEKAEAEARGEKPRRRRRYKINGIDEDSFGTKRKDHVRRHSKGSNVKGISQLSLDDIMNTES